MFGDEVFSVGPCKAFLGIFLEQQLLTVLKRLGWSRKGPIGSGRCSTAAAICRQLAAEEAVAGWVAVDVGGGAGVGVGGEVVGAGILAGENGCRMFIC